MGNEKREVRVLGLEGLILIAVAVDRDNAVRVLVDDDAVGVHAERADVVLELFRAIDDLALVELVSQVGEDDGGDLDAHTDIDAVHFVGILSSWHTPSIHLLPTRPTETMHLSQV